VSLAMRTETYAENELGDKQSLQTSQETIRAGFKALYHLL